MTQDIKRAKVEVLSCCPRQGQIIESCSDSCDRQSCLNCLNTSVSGNYNSDEIMDTDARREFKEVTDSLNAISSELDHQNEISKANKAENESQSKDAKALIRKQREEIRNFFDKLETDIEANVNDVNESNVKRQELVEKLQNDLQALLTDLRNTHKSEQQFSAVFEKSKEHVKTLENDLAKLKSENKIGRYVYQPSQQVQEMLITVKEFGTLIQTESATDNDVTDGNMGEQSAETKAKEESQQNTNSKLEHSISIRARTKDDEQQCTITGVCALPDGFLVVVDCGNSSVKMIDTNQNKIVSVLAMESDPHDVTKVTDDTVAVTLYFKRQIQFLSVSRTKELILSNVLEASSPCYGILHSMDKLTVTHKNKLEVLCMKGETVQSFTTDSKGNQLFSHAKYLTQSPDQDTIYVSDYNCNTVTSLSTDGKVKAVYKDEDLQMPFGLVVDSAGSVYVCGYNSNNIHKMSPDLSRGTVFLDASDGVVMPQSIAYSQDQDRLYVGMWCNDTIRVCQL